jgi:hypothetical protein
MLIVQPRQQLSIPEVAPALPKGRLYCASKQVISQRNRSALVE